MPDPEDFDTSERYHVTRSTIAEPEDPEDLPDQQDCEVYVKDNETGEEFMITFFVEDFNAKPAVKTSDFPYGAVEEAKRYVVERGYEIDEAVKRV